MRVLVEHESKTGSDTLAESRDAPLSSLGKPSQGGLPQGSNKTIGQSDSSPVTPTRGDPSSPATEWLDSTPQEPLPLAPLLQEEKGIPEINGKFKESNTWKEQVYPGWVRVRTIVDSGAAMSIAPPSMATGVAIEESEMSRKGQSFIAADQGRIENQGQQSIHITTNEGREGLTRVQIGDVNRPLMAVSQMCDAGNYVLFTSEG